MPSGLFYLFIHTVLTCLYIYIIYIYIYINIYKHIHEVYMNKQIQPSVNTLFYAQVSTRICNIVFESDIELMLQCICIYCVNNLSASYSSI